MALTTGVAEHGGSTLSLRHRLAERGVDRHLWLLLPGVVFILLLFVYPFLYGLQLSFRPLKGGGALANYRTFFSDSYLRDTIWITLKLGVPAAVLNVAASIPIAYTMRRWRRGRRALTALLVVPLAWLSWQSIYHDGFTLENYRRMFTGAYLETFLLTFKLSIIVTVITLLLGYPVAYFAASLPPKLSALVLGMAHDPIQALSEVVRP